MEFAMLCGNTRNSCSLVSLFLPGFNETKQGQKENIAIATLILNNTLQALTTLQSRRLRKLDALAGDFGCQLQAWKIFNLVFSEPLKKEAEELKASLEPVKQTLGVMRSKLGSRKYVPAEAVTEIFAQKLNAISLSEEMAYLLRAHLLTVTKRYYLKDGYTRDKTEISLLDKLAQGIDGAIRRQIVNFAKMEHSKSSIAFIRAEALTLSTCSLEKRARINFMLQEENIYQSQAEDENFPKSFSCTFYNFKTILRRLRERQVPLLIRNVQKRGEQRSIQLLYRSASPGGAFAPCPLALVQELKTPLIVLEAFIREGASSTEIERLVREQGLYRLLLASAAIEDPFEPKKSDLSMIRSEEAVQEIVKYREKAKAMDCAKDSRPAPLFLLYHVYCSTLAEEKRQLTAGGL
jgi:hypothetical protein